jgi:hypothetical protein
MSGKIEFSQSSLVKWSILGTVWQLAQWVAYNLSPWFWVGFAHDVTIRQSRKN